MLEYDRCWEALESRDPKQDGKFFFGVLTTGVFCRPTCPARRPLRKNVRFYETASAAERDGLRACLRCRPLAVGREDPHTARILEACRYIERTIEEPLQLKDLAKSAGLSVFHFQRTFKAVVGLSPKQFQIAARVKRLKSSLRSSKDVTEAVYEVGYGSSSRVYERAGTRLGMTPSQYRQKGRAITITYATVQSPFGFMMIGATDRGLCFVQFGEGPDDLLARLKKEYPAAELEPMAEPHHPEFRKWTDALNLHLRGAQPRLNLPLDIRATAFQMRVWNYLQSIPYGEVQSYGEVAAGIGLPRAARAVAQACSANTLAIAIPCHRVICGTGELGGYRWGLSRKRALIDHERGTV